MNESYHSTDSTQAPSLLITKLHVPYTRTRRVPRPRLIARLDEGIQRKLTLVAASAGYGKTTLLSEWWHTATGRQVSLAWLSLDTGDNDPVRFWTHCIAALQTLHPDVGKSAQMSLQLLALPGLAEAQDERTRFESILSALINDMVALPSTASDLALVLDDYHVIQTPVIHDSLAFLLDHLPDRLHLVIATREDPPLPLARLRARNQMVEIRNTELRFTTAEVAAFFNDAMHVPLSAADVATLEVRTEGWAAGLQMAALSLRNRAQASDFVAAFSGSHRFVLDYLIEEVLQRQTPEVQTFLLHTAILDRLNAALCDAITGRSDSQAVLERLETMNLFIAPLDDERRWYRYHPLFADLLRHQLNRTQAALVPELHRRASRWLAEADLLIEAISHASAAHDVQRVADLIEQAARRTWMPWMQGEIGAVRGWLEALPPDLIRARPRLGLAYAWALLDPSQMDRIEQHLQEAVRAVNSLQDKSQAHAVLCEVAVIRTFVSSIRGDVPFTIELAREALAGLPETEVFLRSMIAWSLGHAYALRLDMPSAEQALTEALSLSRVAGNHAIALMSMNLLAGIQCDRGRLRESAHMLQQTLELAKEWGGQNFFILSRTWWLQAWLFYEWNDFERAATCLGESRTIAAQWNYWRGVVSAHGLLAMVRQAQGDREGALDLMRQARQAVLESHMPMAADALTVYQLNLWQAQGDLAAAMQWIREHEPDWSDPGNRIHDVAGTAVARILIEYGRKQNEPTWMQKASGLLAGLLLKAETAGFDLDVVDILLLQATLLHAQGLTTRAMTILKRALALAEPEGYVRMFLECGEPMAELLLSVIQSRALGEPHVLRYVRKLLSQFGVSMRDSEMPVAVPSRVEGPVEPLSPREIEVLQLVAAGASDQDIAGTLVLSKATVKAHLRNIYGKLQVGNRTQAVARARARRLLT